MKMSTKNIIYLILFTFIGICSSQDINQKPNPIVFDNPDLVLDHETDSGSIILEAYKFKMNDQIIQNKRHDDYAKLKWYSLGYPELAYSWNKKNESALFKFTPQRFEARVEMLTSKHKSVLRNLIKDMYNISVKDNQIINLALSKFECELSFHQDLEKISIKGKVNELNSFPLKLVFNEPLGSKNRDLFEDRLKDVEEFEIVCDISSKCRSLNTTLTSSISSQDTTLGNQISIKEEKNKEASGVLILKKEVNDLKNFMKEKLDSIDLFIKEKLIKLDKVERTSDNLSLNLDIKKVEIKNLQDNFNKITDDLYTKLGEKESEIKHLKVKFINLIEILSIYSKNEITVNVGVKSTFNGNQGSVFSLVVLPDGDLASGLSDGTINIWNIENATIKRSLVGHTDWVKTLVVLPNGDLASGSYDNTIIIWNKDDGSVKRTLIGHTDFVEKIVVLPNGYLASGSYDGTIKIWNTVDGILTRTLVGDKDMRMTLAVLKNGDLASGLSDGTIKIWNTVDGTIKHTLEVNSSSVLSLVVLPDGDLAGGLSNGTIKIWNTLDGTIKRTLEGHTRIVWSLVVLPNGYLVSGSEDDTIKIWNIEDGTVKRTLEGDSFVYALAVLANGNLASGFRDHSIKIWNTMDRMTNDFYDLIEAF